MTDRLCDAVRKWNEVLAAILLANMQETDDRRRASWCNSSLGQWLCVKLICWHGDVADFPLALTAIASGLSATARALTRLADADSWVHTTCSPTARCRAYPDRLRRGSMCISKTSGTPCPGNSRVQVSPRWEFSSAREPYWYPWLEHEVNWNLEHQQ